MDSDFLEEYNELVRKNSKLSLENAMLQENIKSLQERQRVLEGQNNELNTLLDSERQQRQERQDESVLRRKLNSSRRYGKTEGRKEVYNKLRVFRDFFNTMQTNGTRAQKTAARNILKQIREAVSKRQRNTSNSFRF